MTINIDISDYFKLRGRTGIQRVLKELSLRLLKDERLDYEVRFLVFDPVRHLYAVIPREIVEDLMRGKEVADSFISFPTISISSLGASDVFFDIDSAWHTPLKRSALYKILKQKGVTIYNIVYDLSPLLRPNNSENSTTRNYAIYTSAVLTYSDLMICISRSTERDLTNLANKINLDRQLSTTVVPLGSDFDEDIEDEDKVRSKLPKSLELDKPYMLFVGTVEPRKRHDLALESFDLLSRKHKNLSLVIVGKQGWNSEDVAEKIKNHKQFNKRIFWIDDADDSQLGLLYRYSTLVTYLSSFEGYGLPVAEGLLRDKVTIAFDNSSQYEAGGNLADYARYGTASEVVEIADSYLSDPELMRKKQAYIAQHRDLPTWDDVYKRIRKILDNRSATVELRRRQIPEKLQFVFISNRVDDLQGTITEHDRLTSFVKEYIVVAPPLLKNDIEQIKSKHKVIFINEKKILGDLYEDFKNADHVTKNWMLRSSLPKIKQLDDEFVMNDDDNRPLVNIDIDTFINDDGTYNAYYFFELPRWAHCNSEYDIAQHITTKFMNSLKIEQLLYSSHQPQIINKQLFSEVVSLVERSRVDLPVDEWSTYFNYSISKMPGLFRKRPFETMCWPASPRNWSFMVRPERFVFENYYSELYEEGQIFHELAKDVNQSKMRRVNNRQKYYDHSQILLDRSGAIASELEMVHGIMQFVGQDVRLIFSGIPYIFAVSQFSLLRIDINVKILYSKKLPKNYRISAVDELGNVVAGVGYDTIKFGGKRSKGYYEAVMSFTINAKEPGQKKLTFKAFADDKELSSSKNEYRSVLFTYPPEYNVDDVGKRPIIDDQVDQGLS